jgi:hypothetical protein
MMITSVRGTWLRALIPAEPRQEHPVRGPGDDAATIGDAISRPPDDLSRRLTP